MDKKFKNNKNKKGASKKNTSNTKVYKTVKKSSNSNIVKIDSDFSTKNFIHYKKLKFVVIVLVLIFVLLLVRLSFLQFVDGAYLKELAYQQQTMNQIISPKRGNIYDSTGKTLATSAQVDTITINPSKITNDDDEKAKALKEKVAKGLSEIFELDYDEVLAKVTSTAQVETIIKKVEKEKVDKLKTWMKENDIAVGINIDEDTKRYYPYGTFASNVIGCTGSDNQGLSGLESTWDSVLTRNTWKNCKFQGCHARRNS